ncbi:MAG: hypothetical protein OXH93_11345, partial [Caldilineaceae bacterium]|nr:hypothetical protein [Caldilineaceae bacterium]
MFHKNKWKLALTSGMIVFLLLSTGQQSFFQLPGRQSSALFAQTQSATCPPGQYWCLPSYRNPPWYSCWPEAEIGRDWHCTSAPPLPPGDGNSGGSNPPTVTPTPTTLLDGDNPGDGNSGGSNPPTVTPTPTTLLDGDNPGDG